MDKVLRQNIITATLKTSDDQARTQVKARTDRLSPTGSFKVEFLAEFRGKPDDHCSWYRQSQKLG
jgi:hypothetical protein